MNEGEVAGGEDRDAIKPVKIRGVEGIVGGIGVMEVVEEGLEVEGSDVDVDGG